MTEGMRKYIQENLDVLPESDIAYLFYKIVVKKITEEEPNQLFNAIDGCKVCELSYDEVMRMKEERKKYDGMTDREAFLSRTQGTFPNCEACQEEKLQEDGEPKPISPQLRNCYTHGPYTGESCIACDEVVEDE